MKKIITTIIFIFIINLVISSNALSIHIKSNTIYVDDDGGADYTRIQDAINAANTGDTIYVYNGNYQENLDVYKTLTLEGENRESTIIDGLESDSTISITANNVAINSFTITNCKNSSESAGIYISSDQTIISNNNISRNLGYGIYGENTNGNQIIDNEIIKNNYDGISLISSENNVISNNIIMNHYYNVYHVGIIPRSHGIWLMDVAKTIVSNNTFSDNINSDISVQYSKFINIENNYFIGNSGIFINGELNDLRGHIIENNYVNGKPIYYYKDENDGHVPSDAGQVILVNCNNFKIQNLSIINGDYGIILWYSSNNIIEDNYISNVMDGIYLLYSDNNILNRNTILNVWGNPLQSSSNNIIKNNIYENNTRYGCGLWYSSDNNSVYQNIISNNTEDGVIIAESSNNIISLNSIENNIQSGIEFYKSNNNDIAGNLVRSNLDYGIKFSSFPSSNNNVIHHNILLNNSPYNGYDSGGNIWDLDDLGGNYWDDYIGTDDNGDGFGDQPYNIRGGNEDNFPYMNPITISYPDKPVRPIGPSSGKIKEEFTYNFCGSDSKGLYLYYLVDWGDDSNGVWLGPFHSNLSIDISHIWQSRGEYNIRVKTRNVIGAESVWSDPLSVSMPKNKAINTPVFSFLQNHPILFQLLQRFIKL